jgi:hypothetical protein
VTQRSSGRTKETYTKCKVCTTSKRNQASKEPEIEEHQVGENNLFPNKSFNTSYQNPKDTRCVWGIKILLRKNFRRDSTFSSVDEIEESES